MKSAKPKLLIGECSHRWFGIVSVLVKVEEGCQLHLPRACYDPLIRQTLPQETFRRLVLTPAGLACGDRVLDLGCGTGSHATIIKRVHPDACVVGIDDDPEAIALAKARAARESVAIVFRHGNATQLPFEGQSFDHVFSSFLFHHLDRADKCRTLGEILRILRMGGHLHLVDFARPQGWRMRLAFVFIRLTHQHASLDDNVRGMLPTLLREAGFTSPMQEVRAQSPFGTIGILHAGKE